MILLLFFGGNQFYFDLTRTVLAEYDLSVLLPDMGKKHLTGPVIEYTKMTAKCEF